MSSGSVDRAGDDRGDPATYTLADPERAAITAVDGTFTRSQLDELSDRAASRCRAGSLRARSWPCRATNSARLLMLVFAVWKAGRVRFRSRHASPMRSSPGCSSAPRRCDRRLPGAGARRAHVRRRCRPDRSRRAVRAGGRGSAAPDADLAADAHRHLGREHRSVEADRRRRAGDRQPRPAVALRPARRWHPRRAARHHRRHRIRGDERGRGPRMPRRADGVLRRRGHAAARRTARCRLAGPDAAGDGRHRQAPGGDSPALRRVQPALRDAVLRWRGRLGEARLDRLARTRPGGRELRRHGHHGAPGSPGRSG